MHVYPYTQLIFVSLGFRPFFHITFPTLTTSSTIITNFSLFVQKMLFRIYIWHRLSSRISMFLKLYHPFAFPLHHQVNTILLQLNVNSCSAHACYIMYLSCIYIGSSLSLKFQTKCLLILWF